MLKPKTDIERLYEAERKLISDFRYEKRADGPDKIRTACRITTASARRVWEIMERARIEPSPETATILAFIAKTAN